MERSPFPPMHEPNPPKMPRSSSGSFSELRPRTSISRERAPEQKRLKPKPTVEAQEPTREHYEQPEVRRTKRLGQKVVEVVRAHREKQEAQGRQPENPIPDGPQPEAETRAKTKIETVETSKPQEKEPLIETAERVRSFARLIIERVMRESLAEPARARQARETPVDTEPLIEVAEELREAADDLTEAVNEAKDRRVDREETVAVFGMEPRQPARRRREEAVAPDAEESTASETESDDGNYGSDAPEKNEPELATPTIAEQISRRISRLERGAEVETNTAALALVLGAIAVIATGFEFSSRRHGQSELKKADRKQNKRIDNQQEQIKNLEREQQNQQELYDVLRRQQASGMDRNQREQYYGRLNEVAQKQTVVTRETTQDLHETKNDAGEHPEAAQHAIEAFQRAYSSRDKAEGVAPEHNLRIEKTFAAAEKPAPSSPEYKAARSRGGAISAGAAHAQISKIGTKTDVKAPLSPIALNEAAARKARREHLVANAWLYGTGLIIAILGLLAALALIH